MIKRNCERCGKITAYTGALRRVPGFYPAVGPVLVVNPCYECAQVERRASEAK